MKIWRILYETDLELYVEKETLEEAIAYAKDQEVAFSQVMEISEVQERSSKQ